MERLRVHAWLTLLLGWSVTAPTGAEGQQYYAALYAEVQELHGELDATQSTLTIRFTTHLSTSGYRIQLDPATEEPPTVVAWIERDRESFLKCRNVLRGSLTSSCQLPWSASWSSADFAGQLRQVGGFPPVPLDPHDPADGPLPPCPDDGWHLWILHSGGGVDEQLEHCRARLRWEDREAPIRVVRLLQRALVGAL